MDFQSFDRDAWHSVLLEHPSFVRLSDAVKEGEQATLGGVLGSLFAFISSALRRQTKRPVLLLLPSEDEAEGLADDLCHLDGAGSWVHLPSGQDGSRFSILDRFVHGQLLGMTVSIGAAVDPVLHPNSLADSHLVLARDQQATEDSLLARLARGGLIQESMVVREGTFARKGDIIDVFPRGSTLPLRVEFFDDTVADIREFDPSTQLSIRALPEARFFLGREEAEEKLGCLADYVSAPCLLLLRDVLDFERALEVHGARFSEPEQRAQRAAYERLCELRPLYASHLRLPGSEDIPFGGQVIASSGTTMEAAVETLSRVTSGKRLSILGFESTSGIERFSALVKEHEAAAKGRKGKGGKSLQSTPFLWSGGFHSPTLGLAVLNDRDLFERAVRARRTVTDDALVTQTIDSFLSLTEGDFVVHLIHGIARFEGVRRLEKGASAQDHLVLRFRDEVLVHVPATKIDLVQKYVGGKGNAPELSRFGSGAFEKKKAQVQAAVQDLAMELLEVQAMRERRIGIQHGKDTPWQVEFEGAFPHVLTKDQAKAVQDIKRDLEAKKPMDRLICGDVGYGKTEVAVRAAFKVVMGNRQVAVLVPTTVLAQQHLMTFRDRMRDYPVTIECISRFQTPKEHRRVLEALASGSVDIVIGTHRLLQPDVHFKNLGLLVIDEEQRFGVLHKEKLRNLRRDVDVLVMTATPIPRTLNQALLGIRDVSALSEPPRGRRGVRSEVLPFSEDLIRDAILLELDRGGQVYVVHNRVQSIDRLANRIRALAPAARVLVGHGQMPEKQLEETMLAFIAGEADVLVATTIIESGLDIPRANTLIVDQAHLYGLADLHQLRGRVGRQNTEAQAYFLLRPEDHPTEEAEKRLRAIEEFSALGAGFQIAMRDMEIRGAGNILGPEQSGHIATVGYELYCRLLEAAVKGLKGETDQLPSDVELNLDFTAFIPESYIPDTRQRVDTYRTLSRCRSEGDFQRMLADLRDRFGPPPLCVSEFVLLSRIRGILERARVSKMEVLVGEGLVLTPRGYGRFVERLRPGPLGVRLLSNKSVLLVNRTPFSSPRQMLQFLEDALGGLVAP